MPSKWEIDKTDGIEHWIVQAIDPLSNEVVLAGPLQRYEARIVGEDYKNIGMNVTIRYVNRVTMKEN